MDCERVRFLLLIKRTYREWTYLEILVHRKRGWIVEIRTSNLYVCVCIYKRENDEYDDIGGPRDAFLKKKKRKRVIYFK